MLDILQQSLLMLPLIIGVYLSFTVLKIVDLTVDGSFVLGAGVYAVSLQHGLGQFPCLLLAISAGSLCGVFVAVLQALTKINALLASILTVFMLYSINLAVMGRPNINLLSHPSVLYTLSLQQPLLFYTVLIGLSLMICCALLIFLHSPLGLRCRALGCNQALLKRLKHKPMLYLVLGLMLSNGLAALCGALQAQMNGYADVNMGIGIALTAIGAVVIGETVLHAIYTPKRHFSAAYDLCACFIGIVLYFTVLNLLLSTALNPIYLKLCLGAVLLGFICTSSMTRGVLRHV